MRLAGLAGGSGGEATVGGRGENHQGRGGAGGGDRFKGKLDGEEFEQHIEGTAVEP